MTLKQLKLHKIKSAVTLNDSEKKAIRGRGDWGDALCTLNCTGSNSYYGAPHASLFECLAYGHIICGEGAEFTCNYCN